MLLLVRHELLQAHDMIPLEGCAFLPTERAQVAVLLEQHGLLLACEILSTFSTFDEEQKHLGTYGR